MSSNLTPARVLMSDNDGKVAHSGISATQLDYLNGVTSAIQTQLNNKLSAVTGAASSILLYDLTAERVLVSDSNGKVATAPVSPISLSYIANVTSDVQTQINGKQAVSTGAVTSILAYNLTAERVLVSDSNGKVATAPVSPISLSYIANVTSDVQTQFNGKQAVLTGAVTSILAYNLTAERVLVSDSNGKVATAPVSPISLGYITNVTSDVQTQLNGKASKEVQQNSQPADYTLALSDAGKHILHPSSDNATRTYTIPANSSVAYPIGTVIWFVNEQNTVTISITSDTLALAPGGTTGSRTLAANGMAMALKITATKWMISGWGLT
ncbi:MAG: hypothetical protein HQM04_06490 [Magnetococcales bacterium]|nr:hypothetical protein [Magnetococcales bacterium]